MSRKLTIFGISVIAGVLLVWGCFWYFLRTDPHRGDFGDMFGAANALFAGLAFAGLIIAILLQREDLELQREELKLSREELSGQRQQLEEQNKTLRKQNFEDTFFQLLRLQNDLTESLRIEDRPPSIGCQCFRDFYGAFRERCLYLKRAGELTIIKPAYRHFSGAPSWRPCLWRKD